MGTERAVAGDQARGESTVGEDGDQLHVQFARGVADQFGDGFGDLELFEWNAAGVFRILASAS